MPSYVVTLPDFVPDHLAKRVLSESVASGLRALRALVIDSHNVPPDFDAVAQDDIRVQPLAEARAPGAVAIVVGEDWSGLYEDGVLLMEDHRLRIDRVFDALGIPYEHMEADLDWLYENGRLPERLSDVKTA